VKDISLGDAFGILQPAPTGAPQEQAAGAPGIQFAHHEEHPSAEGQLVLTDKVIRHEGSKWVLHFSDGRKETFDTEAAAKKREQQVQYFKHQKK